MMPEGFKPIPDEDDFEELGLLNHCTCGEYNWPEEVCPFDAEVHDDQTSVCRCCPYHRWECWLDI